MVGGSLTSSAHAGADATNEMQANRTGAKFISRQFIFPPFVSSDETFIEWDHVIALVRWQLRHVRAAACMPVTTPDRLSRIKSIIAQLRIDDRDDLSFGDHVVEFDQYCLDFPCCRRSHRDFHLHGFDESTLAAAADAASEFNGKRAYAAGHFGHYLDFGHSALRDRLADNFIPRTAFCCGRRLPEVACSASGILFRGAEWSHRMGRRSERLSKQGMLASDLAGEGDVIQVVSRAFDVLRCFEGHEARLGNLEISF